MVSIGVNSFPFSLVALTASCFISGFCFISDLADSFPSTFFLLFTAGSDYDSLASDDFFLSVVVFELLLADEPSLPDDDLSSSLDSSSGIVFFAFSSLLDIIYHN